MFIKHLQHAALCAAAILGLTGTGAAAATSVPGPWFVLSEVLGNKKAKLYDGSMHE